MPIVSHHAVTLSIAALAVTGGSMAASTPAASPSLFVGRWTVADDKPKYSARGMIYKSFDVAPCDRDVCGVSVAANGTCGPVLFRFHSTSLIEGEAVDGHGRWGTVKKNLALSGWRDKDIPGGRRLSISLGDGYDLGERSANMPKFSAEYRPIGKARCIAR